MSKQILSITPAAGPDGNQMDSRPPPGLTRKSPGGYRQGFGLTRKSPEGGVGKASQRGENVPRGVSARLPNVGKTSRGVSARFPIVGKTSRGVSADFPKSFKNHICITIKKNDYGQQVSKTKQEESDQRSVLLVHDGVQRAVADSSLHRPGDHVTLYGLFNEHFQQYQTLWNGEYGRTYFFQCETPYDAPRQSAYMSEGGTRDGYAAYKVSDHVQNHFATAFGIYDVLHNDIRIESSVEVPANPGIRLHHICNNCLSNQPGKGFGFVVNGLVRSTYNTHRDNRTYLVDFPEP